MKVQIVKEGLGGRLYLIGFLPRPAETKVRGPIAVIDADGIENRVVYQQLSGVSQSVLDHIYRRDSS